MIGQVAILSQFVSRSIKKFSEFFYILRNPDNFEWLRAYQAAFKKLKEFLVIPLVLSALIPGEELYLYLVVSKNALSLMLVRNVEGNYRPVYYVNQALHGLRKDTLS